MISYFIDSVLIVIFKINKISSLTLANRLYSKMAISAIPRTMAALMTVSLLSPVSITVCQIPSSFRAARTDAASSRRGLEIQMAASQIILEPSADFDYGV